jgi:hypothetical protein
MSDNLLRLIPDVADYVPPSDRVAIAVSTLSSSYPAALVEANDYPEVRFIDAGGNFEAIYCPCSGDKLDLDWWGRSMDQAALSHFADLTVVTPCCGCATSLNELRYHWPAGFARFCLTLAQPPEDIEASIREAVGKVLGASLRRVWVRY